VRLVEVVRAAPADEVRALTVLASTVGAFLVFPLAVHSDGARLHSINQARGIHPRIGDRFDLTLECIRRHYVGVKSPLESVLGRHRGFFDLFGDFRGYVDHFLLNDLVLDNYRAVRFLMTFDDLAGDPLPSAGVGQYRAYMSRMSDFVVARNVRIQRDARSRCPSP
jgi:hypothetical protein